MTPSSGGSASSGAGGGWNRFGPAKGNGDARLLQTGSVRMRTPSISTSSAECPNQVTRSPDEGRVSQNGSGFTSGNGVAGTRFSSGQRNSRIVGRSTPGLSPDDTGYVF